MGVYEREALIEEYLGVYSAFHKIKEYHIYGSDRLGIKNKNYTLAKNIMTWDGVNISPTSIGLTT